MTRSQIAQLLAAAQAGAAVAIGSWFGPAMIQVQTPAGPVTLFAAEFDRRSGLELVKVAILRQDRALAERLIGALGYDARVTRRAEAALLK